MRISDWSSDVCSSDLALERGPGEEMADEVGNVVGALAQRRQPDRHDVEAIEQILAEGALTDELAQVAVRRGDDPHVRLDRRAAADGGVLALLLIGSASGRERVCRSV